MTPVDKPPPVSGAEWRQWRRSVFGDPYLVWHDGPELSALLRIARTDPVNVHRMLAAGLDNHDPVAAESVTALADAGFAPAGSPQLLRTAVPSATGTFLVSLATALHHLTGDEAWAEPVLSVLRTARFWGERMDAAIALGPFKPTADLVRALGQAVCDREYLVRYHAANTLLRYARPADRPAEVYQHPELFELIATPRDRSRRRWRRRASSRDRARWQAASDALRAMALGRLNTEDR